MTDISGPGLNKKIPGAVMLLFIILLVLSISMPGTVDAGIMQWTVVSTPDNSYNVIVSPSEINFLAAAPDGMTMFAADVPHSTLYRSKDGGRSWNDITGNLTGSGAVLPVWNITTAPDNPNFVAAVTSTASVPAQVFISTDGGDTWQNSTCPAANPIGTLDISPNYGNYDIAIGTRTGTGTGRIYVFRGFGGWAEQGFTGDILAVKFSPGYGNDSSLVVAYADMTGTYLALGIRDIPANSTSWGISGPVEITINAAGSSPKANQIITADLELPSDFSGQLASHRRIYICTNDAGATGNAGVYRIDDTLIYKIMSVPGSPLISSIAFYGSYDAGKLLAGAVKADPAKATADVWFCPNPEETCPQSACIVWQKTVKPPTGGAGSGNASAQVLWSPGGDRAYCGTSSANPDVAGWPNGYHTAAARDESALSVSIDNAMTWNQISLIDTEINFLSDVAVSYNTDTVYLSSINTNAGNSGFDSVWRSTSYPPGQIWERVYCLLSPANDIILRINSSTASQSIVIACRASSDMFHSLDLGQTWNIVLPGVTITDCAHSETGGVLNLYVLDNNQVRRGDYQNGIWKWGQKVNTGLTTGHSVTARPGGIVLVGAAAQGMVAYSIDGGTEFVRLPALPASGNIHVIADTRFFNYIILYAASDAPDGQVYSWIVNETNAWTPMGTPDRQFYGLAQTETLYCAWSDGADSGANRTLMPERLGPPLIEWSNMTSGLSPGVVFTREPESLKISGADLWAIDNRAYSGITGRLWTYHDGLSPVPPSSTSQVDIGYLYQAPEPLLPEESALIPVDDMQKPVAIEFRWQHPTLAVSYELWIAEDESFNEPVLKKSIVPEIPSAPRWTLSSKNSPLVAGTTYYWKVRVIRDENYGRGTGEWSATMSFKTGGTQPVQPVEQPVTAIELLTPANNSIEINGTPVFTWSSVTGVDEYEFVLATDEQLSDVIIRASVPGTTYIHGSPLDPGKTYYWQVKAGTGSPSPVFRFTVENESTPGQEPPAVNISQVLWIAGITLLCLIIIILSVLLLRKKVFRARQ
jgi:photosystem II stability/assembly factor-like uncharacterized protein